jgi:hypothetical protein
MVGEARRARANTRTRFSIAVGLVAAAGCGSEGGGRGDGNASASASISVGSLEDGTAGDETESLDGTADESAGDELKFDTPGGATAEGGEEMGCDKVDFLFVIDDSVSMDDNQAALIASFPGFIDAIRDTVEAGSDYHIMVVDTDDRGRCTPENCADPENGDVPQVQELCLDDGGHACTAMFTACDTTMGAGVVHPAGALSTNGECTIAGGNRYLTDQEPDLDGTFACIAQVGTAGHPSERPMDAMVAAVSEPLNQAGGCNAGFLREDALLVVTFISDDPNVEDAGTPQAWYDAVVAAKGDEPSSVVVLGIIPAFAGCAPEDKPEAGVHWAEFVSMWGDQGSSGSVCELDYAPFFANAIGIIDEACDNFVPPG